MLRFLSKRELCREFATEGSHCQPDAPGAPEPRRELNAEDYERIRGMTGWLFAHLQTAGENDLAQAFRRFEIGPLFDFDAELARAKTIKMSPDAIGAALTSAQNLGRVPSDCGDADTGKLSDRCEIAFEYAPGKEGVTFATVVVRIKRARADHSNSSQGAAVESETMAFPLYPDQIVDQGGPLFKTFVGVPDAREIVLFEQPKLDPPPPIGTVVHSLQVAFRADEDAIAGGARVLGALVTDLRVYRSEKRASDPTTTDIYWGMPENGKRLLIYPGPTAPAVPRTTGPGGATSITTVGRPE
jgi:hypothetical protein